MKAEQRVQVAHMLIGPVFALLALAIIVGPLAWSIMADHWILASAVLLTGLSRVVHACLPMVEAWRLAGRPRRETDKT
jgi:hypothetical protein